MPKNIIRAAKSKAKDATANVAPQINAADLRAKAQSGKQIIAQSADTTVASAKRHAIVAKETASDASARLIESETARASREFVADAQARIAESEIGQRATAGLDAARSRAAETTEAVKEGIDRATGAFAIVHGSVLLTDSAEGLKTVRDRFDRLLGGRKNEISAVSLTLHGVLRNLATAAETLDGNMLDKFQSAGLGRGIPDRTVSEARVLFDQSMPETVKGLSEISQNLFLRNKDASHRYSVENAPELARDPNNIVWEHFSSNRSRGSENMTAPEFSSVNHTNAWQGFALSVAEITTRSMLYAAVIEATISITENVIYVYRGGKDVSTAIEDTLKNTAKAGAAGAVIGVVLGVGITALTAVGAAPVLTAIAPALGVVGGGLLIYTAGKRIHKALTTPIYQDGVIVDTDLVRCCADDDERVPATQLVEMLKESERELTALKPDALHQRSAA